MTGCIIRRNRCQCLDGDGRHDDAAGSVLAVYLIQYGRYVPFRPADKHSVRNGSHIRQCPGGVPGDDGHVGQGKMIDIGVKDRPGLVIDFEGKNFSHRDQKSQFHRTGTGTGP